MSTNDVPGYNKSNRDELAMGCWAEHEDGSCIFVESTEAGRVIYCMFDTTQSPIIEYRDAMPEKDFKKNFSWASREAIANLKWTWHDKSPFPWDRIIKLGAKPGLKYASAEDQLTAAARVAEALHIKSKSVDVDSLKDRSMQKVYKLANQLRDAIKRLKE